MAPWTLILRGVLMGAADIVPGISGGTMALILGIYPRFIHALANLNLTLLRSALQTTKSGSLKRTAAQLLRLSKESDLNFLMILGVGIAAAFLSLSHVLPPLLKDYPQIMNGLFFGLILASTLVPLRMTQRKSVLTAALLLGGAFLAYGFTGLSIRPSVGTPVVLFASGALAVSAMLLPGVSGSFLLLLMGQYTYLITALRDLNLPILVVFAAGMALGLIIFSRLLKWLLAHRFSETKAALTGLMLGALRTLWPYESPLSDDFSLSNKAPLIAIAAGLALALLLERLGQSRLSANRSQIQSEDA